MPSYVGWLDSNEAERRRAMEFVATLREPDTLDELGIGPIRDGVADILFPGTSTIQTRARYLLFVPWMYRDLEERGLAGRGAAEFARVREVRLSRVLAAGQDTDGVIGKEAKERLLRLPSSIYWAGLRTFDIRLFPGSQAAYHRALDRSPARERPSDGESPDDDAVGDDRPANWHLNLPSAPAQFPEGATLALGDGEADYLAERITCAPASRSSMLARLLQDGRRWGRVEAPWKHPATSRLPDGIRIILVHAERLSKTHELAALLYNLMVAEAAKLASLVEEYRERIDLRAAACVSSLDQLARWDVEELWDHLHAAGARPAPRAERFVRRWRDEVVAAAGVVSNRPSSRALVRAREVEVKGRRARLENAAYRQLWRGGSSLRPLTFRWRQAEQIALDILSARADGGTDARPA